MMNEISQVLDQRPDIHKATSTAVFQAGLLVQTLYHGVGLGFRASGYRRLVNIT